MIYTYTLNPSIDYYMTVDRQMMETEVNRTKHEQYKIGGKGLNVSSVLSKLKISSTAIALLGGFTGEYIQKNMGKSDYINLHTIPITGINRINVKISYAQKEIAINAIGPVADLKTKEAVLNSLNQIKKGDWVLICGSKIRGIEDEFIVTMSDVVHKKKARLVIDMESLTMEMIRKCRPYLIKPNFYEFKILINNHELELEEIDEYMNLVLEQGVDKILVSLGKKGALLATKDTKYRIYQPSVHAVNSVGAGDSMLAAYIGKLSLGFSEEESLTWAAGVACATVSTVGDTDLEMIHAFKNQIRIEKGY